VGGVKCGRRLELTALPNIKEMISPTFYPPSVSSMLVTGKLYLYFFKLLMTET